MTKTVSRQRGSIIVYILIAIFLTGLLVASMTQGAKKSASSEQIDEVMMYLQADVQTIQSNITECVISYQNNNFCPPSSNGGCVSQFSSQDTGNPNVPFPVYTTNPSAAGTSGAPLASILCPRAPSAQQTIFTNSVTQSLKLLQDTTNYTTTYFNDNTEGVFLRITRAAGISDPLWTEAITRMNTKYSSCAVSYVVPGGTDPTGYTCTNGCLYYWILRLSSSNTTWEHATPPASCP